MIKQLNKTELMNAIPLMWRVFCEYEAVSYSELGKQAFWEAIHSEEYINMLIAYGAYEKNRLVGIIATRNAGRHIALFFVDGEYHNQGIGRSLWSAVLAEDKVETVTVHSSKFAVQIYEKLGFVQTGDIHEDGGIQYVPMRYDPKPGSGKN